MRAVGGEGATSTSGTITGFLLRSRAVSGWPGMHVRAYDRELAEGDDAIVPESDTRRLRLLRLERLAPAVLLALFDGVPAVVHIEEPRRGIQFGVRLDATDDLQTFAAVDPAARPQRPAEGDRREGARAVPARARPACSTSQHLNKTLIAARRHAPERRRRVDAAEFALEMLRFPYRQVFGDVAHPVGHLRRRLQPDDPDHAAVSGGARARSSSGSQEGSA